MIDLIYLYKNSRVWQRHLKFSNKIKSSYYLLNRFVDALRMQHKADGQEMVHLISLLINLVVLVGTGREQLFGALKVQQR